MTGYPPRRPFRPCWFLFGCLAGIGLSIFTALAIWLMNLSKPEGPRTLAVSWGSPVHVPELIIYQAVVTAQHEENRGYVVSARINIGSENDSHSVGTLGTAVKIEEALQKYGTIRWAPEEVTFGSETVTAASVKRKDLEQHR
jgi:hypothetical protein